MSRVIIVMFIRKKPNKSGSISIQVVQKTRSRKQKVVKSFGSVSPDDEEAVERLMGQASVFIREMDGPTLPHIHEEEDVIDGFVKTLSNAQIQVIGPELIFGTLYDRIGYSVSLR